MTPTRSLLALTLVFSAACSNDSLLGPDAPVSTAGLRGPSSGGTAKPRSDDMPGDGWVAMCAGCRWPSQPTEGRQGTAHCRDCDISPEPFFLKVPAGDYVHAGAAMYLEVHGVPAENDLTGCHITLRYTNDDESLTYVETDPVMPTFYFARRGFWRADCWRQDGAHADLDGYAY